VSRYQKGKTNRDFTEARNRVAVASARPYASLHLAPDRQPRQYPTTQFFTGQMPFPTPNQQRQSTEGRNHPHSLKYVPVQLPLTITLAITCRFASRAPLLQQSTDISHPPGSQQQTCSSEKMTASYKSLTGPNTLGPSDLQSWRGPSVPRVL